MHKGDFHKYTINGNATEFTVIEMVLCKTQCREKINLRCLMMKQCSPNYAVICQVWRPIYHKLVRMYYINHCNTGRHLHSGSVSSFIHQLSALLCFLYIFCVKSCFKTCSLYVYYTAFFFNPCYLYIHYPCFGTFFLNTFLFNICFFMLWIISDILFKTCFLYE